VLLFGNTDSFHSSAIFLRNLSLIGIGLLVLCVTIYSAYKLSKILAHRKSRRLGQLLLSGIVIVAVGYETTLIVLYKGGFDTFISPVLSFVYAFAAILLYVAINLFRNLASEYEDLSKSLEEKVEERTKVIEEQKAVLLQESKMASLGTMSRGIGHEIKNPLTIILGYIQSYELESKKKPRTRGQIDELMQKIRISSLRIAKIIKYLDYFSTGGNNRERQTITIEEIIQDVFLVSYFKLKKYNIELIEPNYSDELYLTCNPREIFQVFLALLQNSIQAVNDETQKWIKVEITEEGDRIKIAISDSGKGVPAKLQDKIFDPFFSTNQMGQGLGLSMSKGIMAAHGGSLKLDIHAKNTCFSLTFPRVQNQSQKKNAA